LSARAGIVTTEMKPGARRRVRLGEPNKSKQIQATPNKTKLNSLDLLGVIRPNRGFSMGYSESK
jgi:hypothetical protein